VANNFRKRFLTNLGVSGAIILALIIATYLIGSDLNRRAANIAESTNELKFRNNAAQSLVILREEARQALRYRNVLGNLLPTQDELIAFPREIRSLASTNKVTLSFAFGEQTRATAERAGFIGFDMTTTGQFADFLAFLRGLEGSAYFINFSALDVSRVNNASNSKLIGKVFSRD